MRKTHLLDWYKVNIYHEYLKEEMQMAEVILQLPLRVHYGVLGTVLQTAIASANKHMSIT